MNGPTAAQLATARRLLAIEGGGASGSGDWVAAADRVYTKVFVSLSPLIGATSVHLILARSAKRMAAQFPCLSELTPASDQAGMGQALRECLVREPAEDAVAAASALFAAFFSLLTTLIGERLTMQVVTTAWPTFQETNE